MKTIDLSSGYILQKLDRNYTPKQSTTKIVWQKVGAFTRHMITVIASMTENGYKQLQRIEGERMHHIIELSRSKRQKAIYSAWGNPQPKTHRDKVRLAINHYNWQQSQLKGGLL